MNQLFQIKHDPDQTDQIWDVVTCATTKQKRFLCGPAEPTYDLYMALITQWGQPMILKGRMDTSSYILPFPIFLEGEPIGIFVKAYLGTSQRYRAQKEWDSIQYLGRQPQATFPQIITSANFPRPRLLFDQLLFLPLVLSTPDLIQFCQDKTQFYQDQFQLAIDLDYCRPVSQPPSPIQNNHLKVLEDYKRMAVHLLLRNQLEAYGYIHGDTVESNVIAENGRNLIHRLTGQWPTQVLVGLKCLSASSSEAVVAVHHAWPTLIDYDTVFYPGSPFQNLPDYFSETPYILKAFSKYDLLKGYLETLNDVYIPLIRKTVVKTLTGQQRRCCITYWEEHERLDPFSEKEENGDDLDSPPATFHALHTDPTLHPTWLNKYLWYLSSYMVAILRIYNATLEEPGLTVETINQHLDTLESILPESRRFQSQIPQASILTIKIK